MTGAVLLAGHLTALNAHGEGFRNPPAGAFSLGRAGGRIAHIDQASAIQHNPANLMDLKQPEVEASITTVYIKTDYTSPTGVSTETRDPWKFLPNFFAAVPLLDKNVAFGLGITTPYGISNEWDPSPTSPFHYTTAHFAELKVINFNPTVSARVSDRLKIGVGVDIFYSDIDLKQFYPWFLVVPGFPEGELHADASGTGFGGNIGLTFDVTEKQRVALTYRSPVTVDYDGDFEVSGVPGPLSGLIPASSSFSSRIQFPTIVSLGYGIELTDTIRVEADVEWLEFSNFDSLPLRTGASVPGVPSSIPENWEDTFTIGIGGDWQFAPNWVWRASYQFYESPVPSETLSPTIPDANQHALTTGIGVTCGKHRAELAYSAVLYEDRTISSTILPPPQGTSVLGTYETTVHLISLSYHYAF
jgi:long-chain fatty acid transport protein